MLHTLIELILIELILIELILKAGACSSRIGVKAELRVVKLALETGLGSISKPEPVVNALRLPTSLVAIVK